MAFVVQTPYGPKVFKDKAEAESYLNDTLPGQVTQQTAEKTGQPLTKEVLGIKGRQAQIEEAQRQQFDIAQQQQQSNRDIASQSLAELAAAGMGARSDIQQGVGQAAGALGTGTESALAALAARQDRLGGVLDQPGGLYGSFEQDPGYQFRQQQGEQAINRAASAMGGRVSGRTLQELAGFNQGLASQEFANYAQRQGQLAALAAQSDVQGLQAASQAAGLQAGLGGNLANLYAGQGSQLANLGLGVAGQRAGVLGQTAGLNTGLAQSQMGALGQQAALRSQEAMQLQQLNRQPGIGSDLLNLGLTYGLYGLAGPAAPVVNNNISGFAGSTGTSSLPNLQLRKSGSLDY